MALPDESDTPPNARELKVLQGFAGEFNWLATRTRADLAYYTSVISSAATKHGEWTLQLCKKVLRYLCGTVGHGLRLTVGGDETTLVGWSDAGYGGMSTKSQTGVLIAWGGSVVLWRSSRQSTAALSTCEAEVSAAALTFQILEGLKGLLIEWGVQLHAPILLIDNKSALCVSEFGGTWRTRYFAVRATRLADENLLGNINLRYCPTADMGADSLTKMSTSTMLENMRNAMNAQLPAIPGEDRTVKDSDSTWWAAMVFQRQHASTPVASPGLGPSASGCHGIETKLDEPRKAEIHQACDPSAPGRHGVASYVHGAQSNSCKVNGVHGSSALGCHGAVSQRLGNERAGARNADEKHAKKKRKLTGDQRAKRKCHRF